MLNWLFSKSLKEHLYATKKVRINGITFEIKKLNTINYLDGTNTIKQTFETYKNKQDLTNVVQEKKVIEYFSDVICGCVVTPRITHKKEDTGIWVQDLFVDWDLVVAIYNEIMSFTYGKKKMKQLASQSKG